LFVTYDRSTVHWALSLRAEGLGATQIAASTGVRRATVSMWLAGRVPRCALPARADDCSVCGGENHGFDSLPASYAYLLGLYLGDGCISSHPRKVFRLRVVLDTRYPEIIREAGNAMAVVVPKSRVGEVAHGTGAVEVSCYSKSWPCFFPQHGPGKKHERSIRLVDWQQRIADDFPGLLLRGLIHSDGCRFVNTGRGGWRAPRYSFVNTSSDIRDIFCRACDLLGLKWTTAPDRAARVVYVSRGADVALLDRYVGPKT